MDKLILDGYSKHEGNLLAFVLKTLTIRQLFEFASAIDEVRTIGYGTVSIIFSPKSDYEILEVSIRTKLSKS